MGCCMPELLWPALVVFVGYVLLGLTGFGSALIIVPLLSWKWPLPHVVALTLLLDVPACLLHGGLNLRQVQWREVRSMWPGLVAGSAVGLWLTRLLEPRWPLLMLGLYVATTGLRQLLRPERPPQTPPADSGLWAGGVAGAVEMMFGTAGPVLMAWLRWRLPNVMHLRATAPVLIVCSACIVLMEMALAGQLVDVLLWQHWLVLAGIAMLGLYVGDRSAHWISRRRLAHGMAVLLVLSGVSLLKGFFSAE